MPGKLPGALLCSLVFKRWFIVQVEVTPVQARELQASASFKLSSVYRATSVQGKPSTVCTALHGDVLPDMECERLHGHYQRSALLVMKIAFHYHNHRPNIASL